MEFNRESIFSATQKFILEAENYSDTLNVIRDSVYQVEQIFNNMHMNFSFEYLISNQDGKSVSIAWDHCVNSNRFRMKIIIKQLDENGEEKVVLNRAFVDTKIPIRVQYAGYIEPFIESFTNFIAEKRKQAGVKLNVDK